MSARSWSDGGLCLKHWGRYGTGSYWVWRRVFIEEIGPIVTDKRPPASGPDVYDIFTAISSVLKQL